MNSKTMTEIGFAKNSKFYSAYIDFICAERNQIPLGKPLAIDLGGNGMRRKPTIVRVEANLFQADFSGDVTTFGARLKALAAALRDKGYFGLFLFEQKGSITSFQLLNCDEEYIVEAIYDDESLTETERTTIVQARVGHGRYRDALLELEKKCRVTGTTDPRFLRASHVKPWRLSDNQERVDPNNGLLLAPHIDVLFDQGWISFDAKGQLMVSDSNIATQLTLWNIPLELCIGNLNPGQQAYMEYHFSFIYKGSA